MSFDNPERMFQLQDEADTGGHGGSGDFSAAAAAAAAAQTDFTDDDNYKPRPLTPSTDSSHAASRGSFESSPPPVTTFLKDEFCNEATPMKEELLEELLSTPRQSAVTPPPAPPPFGVNAFTPPPPPIGVMDFKNLLPLPPELAPPTTNSNPLPLGVIPTLPSTPPVAQELSSGGGKAKSKKPRRKQPQEPYLLTGPQDRRYELPDGWSKLIIQRKSGQFAGKFDTYLMTPNGTKIRSNQDLLRFVRDNPFVKMDINYVNMEKPIDDEGKTPLTKKVMALQEGVKEIQEKGQMPEGLFPNCSNLTQSYSSNAKSFKTNNNCSSSSPTSAAATPATTVQAPTFSQSQVLQLEAYFYQLAQLPSEEQVAAWADELKLDKNDVAIWFKTKWLARLKYEARLAFQQQADERAAATKCKVKQEIQDPSDVMITNEDEGALPPPTGGGLQGLSRCPINPDILLSFPLDQQPVDVVSDDQDTFVIEYDNPDDLNNCTGDLFDNTDGAIVVEEASENQILINDNFRLDFTTGLHNTDVEIVVEDANEDEIMIDENFFSSDDVQVQLA